MTRPAALWLGGCTWPHFIGVLCLLNISIDPPLLATKQRSRARAGETVPPRSTRLLSDRISEVITQGREAARGRAGTTRCHQRA